MPIYEFIGPKGERIEEFFHHSDAPSIGQVVKIGGVKARRVPPTFGQPTMVDSKNMDPAEIAMHLDHKRDIERRHQDLEFRERGPREFRPEIPRTVY